MVKAALLIIVKNWNQLKCLSVGEQTVIHPHGLFFSHKTTNYPYLTTWMVLKGVMLGERNQPQNITQGTIPFI